MFSATFKDGIPAGFELLTGLWLTARGVLRQSQAEGVSMILAGDPDWNDYSARVRVRFTADPHRGAEAGLVLHWRDSKNYLVFSLKHKEGGSFAVLRIEAAPGLRYVGDQAHLSLDLQEWHDLRADVHGVDVHCCVDGRHVADFGFAGAPPAYNSHGKTWPEDPTQGRAGLITVNATAEFDGLEVIRLTDFSHIVTPQKGHRDGGLLPRQSYAETMRRFTEWMIRSDTVTDKAKAPESIRRYPPCLITNFEGADDRLWNLGGEFAFNHAILITGAVQYYAFCGDRRALDMAMALADWDIAHSTPADAALPHLPPSVVTWHSDGSWEGADWGLLENPVQTGRWVGLYGDIKSGVESYDQWVALETAMYLIDRRAENPAYVDQAREILDWVMRTLGVDYGFHPGVPGVVEQSTYKIVLTHHELRFAEMHAKLFEVTRDPAHRAQAIEIANSVTWCLMSDGKMRQGFWAHAQAAPLVLCFNDQFCRIMAAIPETAPDGENHILQTTGLFQAVRYERSRVVYRTIGVSLDTLKVAGAPKAVKAGGLALREAEAPGEGRDGWAYDAQTHLLKVGHRAPDVEVVFE
ncbi:MAG: hypothetical protein EXS64_11120 [Candidatus Latescibacteria bacterium]|nr:hypothetical protein [Candidatus Latescibacterota bacterium]